MRFSLIEQVLRKLSASYEFSMYLQCVCDCGLVMACWWIASLGPPRFVKAKPLRDLPPRRRIAFALMRCAKLLPVLIMLVLQRLIGGVLLRSGHLDCGRNGSVIGSSLYRL